MGDIESNSFNGRLEEDNMDDNMDVPPSKLPRYDRDSSNIASSRFVPGESDVENPSEISFRINISNSESREDLITRSVEKENQEDEEGAARCAQPFAPDGEKSSAENEKVDTVPVDQGSSAGCSSSAAGQSEEVEGIILPHIICGNGVELLKNLFKTQVDVRSFQRLLSGHFISQMEREGITNSKSSDELKELLEMSNLRPFLRALGLALVLISGEINGSEETGSNVFPEVPMPPSFSENGSQSGSQTQGFFHNDTITEENAASLDDQLQSQSQNWTEINPTIQLEAPCSSNNALHGSVFNPAAVCSDNNQECGPSSNTNDVVVVPKVPIGKAPISEKRESLYPILGNGNVIVDAFNMKTTCLNTNGDMLKTVGEGLLLEMFTTDDHLKCTYSGRQSTRGGKVSVPVEKYDEDKVCMMSRFLHWMNTKSETDPENILTFKAFDAGFKNRDRGLNKQDYNHFKTTVMIKFACTQRTNAIKAKANKKKKSEKKLREK